MKLPAKEVCSIISFLLVMSIVCDEESKKGFPVHSFFDDSGTYEDCSACDETRIVA
jgi:hypothetical protein